MTTFSQEIRKFKVGDLILKQGDLGSNAYRILKGEVEVFFTQGHERVVLGQLGPGEIFGEMGMIEDKPRSASVEALHPTEVEVVTPALFNQYILSKPDQLVPYLKSFFERLRRTNELSQSMLRAATLPPAEQVPSKVFRVRLQPTTEILRNQPSMKDDIEIRRFPYRIGRWSENCHADVFVSNDLLIHDDTLQCLSRNHCAIEREGNQFNILDRGSARGTIVNGKLIGGKESQMLARLHVGLNELQLGGADSPFYFYVHIS